MCEDNLVYYRRRRRCCLRACSNLSLPHSPGLPSLLNMLYRSQTVYSNLRSYNARKVVFVKIFLWVFTMLENSLKLYMYLYILVCLKTEPIDWLTIKTKQAPTLPLLLSTGWFKPNTYHRRAYMSNKLYHWMKCKHYHIYIVFFIFCWSDMY